MNDDARIELLAGLPDLLGSPVRRKEARAALDAVAAELAATREVLDCADWYVTCLRDVLARKPVRGLDEAEAVYTSARAALAGSVAAKHTEPAT